MADDDGMMLNFTTSSAPSGRRPQARVTQVKGGWKQQHKAKKIAQHGTSASPT
ncbi:hypothetical protein K7432_013718, partial [Basidiobolus ranarum]